MYTQKLHDNNNNYDNNNYEKISYIKDKFVILRIYLTDLSDSEIVEKYLASVEKQQNMVVKYINRYFTSETDSLFQYDLETGISENVYTDAGFDLFVPNSITIDSGQTQRIDMRVKCSMTHNDIPCSYYMYPRSSTGAKTPLRMANSVGIIDSGYRGNLIAVFDNIKNSSYDVSSGDRLVQICNGNLHYPIFPIIVESLQDLGTTERGLGGFGSTGR